MRILMVDDHSLFRMGFELLLKQMLKQPDLEIVHADNFCCAQTMIKQQKPFDLIFLDWHMSDMKGVTSLESLRSAVDVGRIVILSGERNPHVIMQCVEHGASGFIPKEYTGDELTHALKVITGGRVFLPTQLLQQNVYHSTQTTLPDGEENSIFATMNKAYPELTVRQIEVLRELSLGLSNKQIARRLNISEDTVKHHLMSIFQIIGIKKRAEAVVVMAKMGLVLT